MDESDSRFKWGDLKHLFEPEDPDIQEIITCLQKTDRLKEKINECWDKCSEISQKDILFCSLLNELADIENILINIENELVNTQNHTLSCATDSVLTCGQFVPGNIQTIATDREGNVVDTPAATKHSQLGQLFSAIDTSNITPLASRTFQITNPANSGKVLHIERVVGGIFGGEFFISLFQNAAPLTNPVPRTIVNRNWSSTNTSTASANASASAPAGGSNLQISVHSAGYFELEFEEELVIPSAATDQTFTVQIVSLSQSLLGVALTIVWSETM